MEVGNLPNRYNLLSSGGGGIISPEGVALLGQMCSSNGQVSLHVCLERMGLHSVILVAVKARRGTLFFMLKKRWDMT